MIGLGIGVGKEGGGGRKPFGHLFAAGEVGGVIDLSPLDMSWRRNLLLYSEQLSHETWSKNNVANLTLTPAAKTVVVNGQAVSLEKLQTSNEYAGVWRVGETAAASGSTRTLSVFCEADTANAELRLILGGPAFSSINVADINLTTKSVTVIAGSNAVTIEDFGGGLLRVKYTAITTVSADIHATIYSGTSAAQSMFVGGAQLDRGSNATPYQKITDLHTEVRALYPNAYLYQDTAGLQPVTAPGQTVALAKMQPGSIEFAQANASLRPTYAVRPKGGRRNLFLQTENAAYSYWIKSYCTVTSDVSVAPTGALAMDRVTDTADASLQRHTLFRGGFFGISAGQWYCLSRYVKAGTSERIELMISGSAYVGYNPKAILDPSTGSVTLVGSGALGGAEDHGNGVWRLWLAAAATANGEAGTYASTNNGASDTYIGNGARYFDTWGHQFEPGNAPTPYQRVTTAFDVYEAGKPHYGALWFDGVDDFLVSGTVTPGTDKVQVFTGLRRLGNDGIQSVVLESSASYGANNGVFTLQDPPASALGPLFGSKGTVSSAINSSVSRGDGYVLAAAGDISADGLSLRVDAAAPITSAADQGTGNHLAYPLYMGRRGGTSLPFNGEIEGYLGVRFGPNLSDAQLAQIAATINAKTGAYA